MADHARACDAALELLDRYGVEEPSHIVETDIAYAEGLNVVYGELGSAAARLTLLGNRGTIRLPVEQRGLPWARFGIAHELGHLVLHRGTGAFCRHVEIEGWCVDEEREAEANAFAAELLMPRTLVHSRCEVGRPSLRVVWSIADVFGVSFPAAASRLMELTNEPAAFAVSVQGRVRWFRLGRTWPFPRLERGSTIDPRTLASRLTGTGRVDSTEVPLGSWTTDDGLDALVVESCIDAPAYGRTVSLLVLGESESLGTERGGP